MYDLFSKEKKNINWDHTEGVSVSHPRRLVDARASPGSHDLLLSRTLNVESLGDRNQTFLTHGLSGKLPPVKTDLLHFNILRIFQHMVGTKG